MVVLGRFVINKMAKARNRQAHTFALPNNFLSNFIVFSLFAESSYLSCRDDIN
jgi:hypothetical protein